MKKTFSSDYGTGYKWTLKVHINYISYCQTNSQSLDLVNWWKGNTDTMKQTNKRISFSYHYYTKFGLSATPHLRHFRGKNTKFNWFWI